MLTCSRPPLLSTLLWRPGVSVVVRERRRVTGTGTGRGMKWASVIHLNLDWITVGHSRSTREPIGGSRPARAAV